MRTEEAHSATKPAPSENFDVLIVGAGISGIGAAYHLTHQCPAMTFAVLEAKDSFGGTWHTHRYPGARSDSDLYTYGYRFKPWTGPPIATREEILAYMSAVIAENGLAPHIRYGMRIVAADWSNETSRWTLSVERAGETLTFTANFLWMCQGYYRHEEGHTPDWPGMSAFRGRIVHPQSWPEDLSVAGKTVVVVGSGATAATLIPAIADASAHVTLLQRSPTYFHPGRDVTEFATALKQLEIPDEWFHELMRRRMLVDRRAFAQFTAADPANATEFLLAHAREALGPDFPMEHFTPRYPPWRQRLALVPDDDLFKSVRSGKVSVATDEIDHFDDKGMVLKSGGRIDADIVVTATGFNLSALGDIAFSLDGAPLDFAGTVTWQGMMFTGVPNMAWVFGYLRESWTMRADLVADFVCRLLNHMKEKGVAAVRPELRPEERDMPRLPWIDPADFNPGYVLRGQHLLPRRGDKAEWAHTQDYWADRDRFPAIDLDGEALVYG